jgi:hypothetical protein
MEPCILELTKESRAEQCSAESSKPLMERLKLQHQVELELARIRLQQKLVTFTCRCVAFGLVSAMSMFFLQGFGNRSGFHLDGIFMHWIGTATVGCVSTLAILVYKCVFAGRHQEKRMTIRRNPRRVQ